MNAPTASQAASSDEVFASWMAELDALQALRDRDPSQALERIRMRREGWSALPEAEDNLLRARFALQAGAALLMLGRHPECQRELALLEHWLARPALATASAGVRQQARRCAIAGANAAAVLAHSIGDFAGALRAYLRALELARALGDARFEAHVLVNLANTFEECGLPAESLEHSRLALGIASALAMDELVGDIHHNIGNALAATGEHEAGLASNQRALQAYAALQLPQKQSYALVAVAERLLELGRLGEAAAALQQRAPLALNFVNQHYEAYAAYTAGRIAQAQGDRRAARQAFAHALAVSADALADRVGQARARVELARLDLADGLLAPAGEHARAALALLEPSQAQRDLMLTHQLLSRIAKADGDLALALHHHELFHAGYERCFNDESARKARLLAVRHEVDLARADAQRQRLENARLAEALAQIGARLNRSAPPADGEGPAQPADLQALGLTPREAEVLFWVTQGKTNEDVMAILGTSLSAVKKHLGRIFQKLGVENRTAAANAARRARSR